MLRRAPAVVKPTPAGALSTEMRSSILTVVAALVAACSPGEAPTSPAWEVPEGAVLQIGPGDYLAEPAWILVQDVDRWLPTIALVEPTETTRSHRRKALTNLVIPQRVIAALLPEEREACLERVTRTMASVTAGEVPAPDGPQVERIEGNFVEVGLDRFGVASQTPPGEWSEIYEGIAGFSSVRLIEGPAPGEWTVNTRITIEHVSDYFIRPEDDPRTLIEDARRDLGIQAVDPEWEWILPMYFQYRQPGLDD